MRGPVTVLRLPSTRRKATWSLVRWPTFRANGLCDLRGVRWGAFRCQAKGASLISYLPCVHYDSVSSS
jgi:hypothetical protein